MLIAQVSSCTDKSTEAQVRRTDVWSMHGYSFSHVLDGLGRYYLETHLPSPGCCLLLSDPRFSDYSSRK